MTRSRAASLAVVGLAVAVSFVAGAVLDDVVLGTGGSPRPGREEPGVAGGGVAERPLHGPVPEDLPVGEADPAPAGMPRYIPALDRDGEHAGYVDYDGMVEAARAVRDESLPVYDDALERVVGHMVPGYGFVPEGTSLADVEPFDVEVREGDF